MAAHVRGGRRADNMFAKKKKMVVTIWLIQDA
jgi:hypothetical protein